VGEVAVAGSTLGLALEELEDGFGGLADFSHDVGPIKEGNQQKNCPDHQ
jgi:hypothetical protein